VRKLIKACLVLGLLTQAEFALGSAFKVTPVRVTLAPGSASTLLTLSNESDQTLRFQISAFGWSQDPDEDGCSGLCLSGEGQ
jgi:P pilus assembly chaperone PapD